MITLDYNSSKTVYSDKGLTFVGYSNIYGELYTDIHGNAYALIDYGYSDEYGDDYSYGGGYGDEYGDDYSYGGGYGGGYGDEYGFFKRRKGKKKGKKKGKGGFFRKIGKFFMKAVPAAIGGFIVGGPV